MKQGGKASMSQSFPIFIEFQNTQTDEYNDKNVIKIRTEGKIYHRQDETVIFYKDSANLDENSSFTLSIPHDKKELSMVRFGENKMQIRFTSGGLWESNFSTPYGNIPISFATQVLDYEIGEMEGYVSLHYTMEFNHQNPLRNDVHVKYRPIKE